jgi:hypothetical protein
MLPSSCSHGCISHRRGFQDIKPHTAPAAVTAVVNDYRSFYRTKKSVVVKKANIDCSPVP